MALKNEKAPPGIESAANLSQRRRWLLFGTNVVVALLLATIIAVAAVWLSGTLLKGKARSDWTSTGRFSLSPRTKALLADLKTDVRITVLFDNPEPGSYGGNTQEEWKAKEALRRRDVAQYERLSDFVAEVAQASRRITVENVNPLFASEAEALANRLRAKYKDEFARTDELLKTYGPFQKELDAFVKEEVSKIMSFSEDAQVLPPQIGEFLNAGGNQLVMLSDKVHADLLAEQNGLEAAPTEEKATFTKARAITTYVTDFFQEYPQACGRALKVIQATPAVASKASPALLEYLKTAAARYEPLQKKAEGFRDKFQKAGSPKFDQIEQAIGKGDRGVLLETDTDALYLPASDLWVAKQEAGSEENPDEAATGQQLFVGESVLASALAGLVQPEKPAILFVTFGAPASGYGGPYYELGEWLRKANFIVDDWDLARSPQMPKPEHMTKAILVLGPPPPPSQRQPVPASTEQYQSAIDAVKGGAPAILMCEPGGMFNPTVPFDGLFPLFGVTPDFRATAVQNVVVDAAKGLEQATPQFALTHFPDTPITRPLGGLPTVFEVACPLAIAKPLPEGVTAQPIVEMPGGSDYWAETNSLTLRQGKAKFDPATDRPGPLPLGVMATRTVGGGEQRAVLFGGHFAEYAGSRYRRQAPGNSELFLNSVLWAAGSENLIATSAEALQARRLSDPGAWETPLKLFLIGGLPTLVLLAGILVYLARRR